MTNCVGSASTISRRIHIFFLSPLLRLSIKVGPVMLSSFEPFSRRTCSAPRVSTDRKSMRPLKARNFMRCGCENYNARRRRPKALEALFQFILQCSYRLAQSIKSAFASSIDYSPELRYKFINETHKML